MRKRYDGAAKRFRSGRLLLCPMDETELDARIAHERDEFLRRAYAEARRRAAGPDQAPWHTLWRMELKSDGQTIGVLGFRGAPADQTVELNYRVREAFQGGGYDFEAVRALCGWAFSQRGVYFIRAAANKEDLASERLLEKLRFTRAGEAGGTQTLWELEKPAPAWMTALLLLCSGGAGLTGIGLFRSYGAAAAMGLAVLLGLGAAFDVLERAKRRRIGAEPSQGERKERPPGGRN